MQARRHDQWHGRRALRAHALREELAPESERAGDANRGSLLERANRTDCLVVRDEPREVGVRGDWQLRRDRANLTTRDELQHPGFWNPGRLRDVACGVDVVRNGAGTNHGCACVTSKALPQLPLGSLCQ